MSKPLTECMTLEEHTKWIWDQTDINGWEDAESCRQALTHYAQQAYARAIEDAAKACEGCFSWDEYDPSETAATVIRALADPPDDKPNESVDG